MPPDTLVFIPAWNEEENLPAVLDELRRRARRRPTYSSSTTGPPTGRRPSRVRTARRSSRSARTGGCGRGSPPATRTPSRAGYAFTGRVDADGQHPVDELARLLEIVRSGDADVAVGSRFATGDGYEAYRYEPSRSRRLGTSLLRRAMGAALGRPFHDATSGMYAANRLALPALSARYTSGAPEVESLLRLREAGLRVVEVPVHMRERASGESKLRGGKAVRLVVTVVSTLLLYGVWRRLRRTR